MDIFTKTTIQKGLENILPDLRPEEESKIFGIIAKIVNEYQFNPDSDTNKFYKLLCKKINDESEQPTDDEISFGTRIYHNLKQRMKSYSIPLNPNEGYLLQKRKRELNIIGRIKNEDSQ